VDIVGHKPRRRRPAGRQTGKSLVVFFLRQSPPATTAASGSPADKGQSCAGVHSRLGAHLLRSRGH
jgi:hypothetical protein